MMRPSYRTAGTFHLLSTPAALTTPRHPQSRCDGLSHFKRTQASPLYLPENLISWHADRNLTWHASRASILTVNIQWLISSTLHDNSGTFSTSTFSAPGCSTTTLVVRRILCTGASTLLDSLRQFYLRQLITAYTFKLSLNSSTKQAKKLFS